MFGMEQLEELNDYLSSDDRSPKCMMLSDLDGFLHGLACSPVDILPMEWMPVALGMKAERVPKRIGKAITSHFTNIFWCLEDDPPTANPIFLLAEEGRIVCRDWSEGFMDAVSLRPKEWLRLRESGTHGQLMVPIMFHLLNDDCNCATDITREEFEKAIDATAKEIPKSVVGIYQFWSNIG